MATVSDHQIFGFNDAIRQRHSASQLLPQRQATGWELIVNKLRVDTSLVETLLVDRLMVDRLRVNPMRGNAIDGLLS